MLTEEAAELDKWAAQSGERAAIEDFLQMAETRGVHLDYPRNAACQSLASLLDEFFEINRPLLESARRALLAENTGWTMPTIRGNPE